MLYFSKRLLLFQILNYKSKIATVSSFKIHNLEENRIYFKTIGLHFAYY